MFARHYNYPRFGTTIEEVKMLAERNVYGNLHRDASVVRRKRQIARTMRDMKYSYPEIADALGYRTHTSVIDLLKDHDDDLREVGGKDAE